VRRGLAPSRERAREAIESGRVVVGGAPAAKAARLVDPGEAVEVLGPPPRFVGRGGEKLDAALERMAIEVAGRRCLDAGASTGGFTDCLLQRGAASVIAVDVGYGQLHERLRTDPRVHNLERTNVRHLAVDDLAAHGGSVDLVVGDLSFISLRTVLAPLLDLVVPGADVVLLVKPQFEAGRAAVSRGKGVVRDPEVWREVLDASVVAAAESGAAIMGCMVSPLTGAEGNVEFLLHLRAPGGERPAVDAVDLDAVVAEAVARHGVER
jgi:23S rRNA (cytidine1920-2'-O)/16S rRNA (cytidine1409-2'-O)-methyltransferase